MKENKNVKSKKIFGIIEPVVFWPAFVIMIFVSIFGLFQYRHLLKALIGIYTWATNLFGWTYMVITVLFLVGLIAIMFSPIGKKRLGGENAKPELSTFAWFSITLTSTIGISLIMWGSVEPIVHFTNPPYFAHVKALSEGAATFALSTGYIHWSFNQYALYTFCGVAVALAHFNYKQPLGVGAGMYFATKGRSWANKLADMLCLIVIVGGVATSLGIGISQLAAGLNYSFGIKSSTFANLAIVIVIVVTYSIASVSGIKKGINYISQTNVWIFFGLLLFTYIVGPTNFINKLGIQALGDFLNTGIQRTMMTSPISKDPWVGNWTQNFYIANAAFAPLLGVFLAKLGKGRTIRQFIGVNLFVCSIFNIIWFNIFGGAAIFDQLHKIVNISAAMSKGGLQVAAFAFFSHLPLGKIIVPIFTLAIFLSFVTMAESLTTSMAAISMKGGLSANEDEPSTVLKLIWGVFVGILAYYLLGLMGVDVIKYTYMVFGFPIFIILFIMGYSLLKAAFFPNFELIGGLEGMFHAHKGDDGRADGENLQIPSTEKTRQRKNK